MASYKDIAKLTNLSVGTVSNVMQGKASVKKENYEKVQQAMVQLGYRIDYQARSLASSKSHLIGLVISSTENIQETKILMPMETFAEENNCRILTATSRNNTQREKDNCEAMLSSKVDGLFIFMESLENQDYFMELSKKESTPIILLARYFDNCPFPYAAVDNLYAAKCMVEYVYAKGHRSVTYLDIADGFMLSPNKQRRSGVEYECVSRGMAFQLNTYQSYGDDIDTGFQAGEALIQSGTLPKLVFPRDDSMAIGFYNACAKHQIRVPEDVSIMSFGRFYSKSITPKKLTTYERNYNEVVKTATDIFLAIQTATEEGTSKESLPTKVFIKGYIDEGETILDINQIDKGTV